MTKNSGGLGFSVLQMEGDGCEHLGGSIIRIKRLFPAQPAEENGKIEVGDIILAVNGKPIQGLLYQVLVLVLILLYQYCLGNTIPGTPDG